MYAIVLCVKKIKRKENCGYLNLKNSLLLKKKCQPSSEPIGKMALIDSLKRITTNLKFVKNRVSVMRNKLECNKMRYMCIRR